MFASIAVSTQLSAVSPTHPSTRMQDTGPPNHPDFEETAVGAPYMAPFFELPVVERGRHICRP
ncbi:MAG: hypothetical protein ACYTFM_12945 [Planctomycetota bacterium]